MSTKPKPLTLVAILLQVVFALITIFLAYRHLNSPLDRSEFGGLENLSILITGVLAILFSLLLVWFAYYLFRLKGWGYIVSMILIVLDMLVIGAGSISALIFELSPGAPLSVTSEILPSLVLLLLILSFKDFRKKA